MENNRYGPVFLVATVGLQLGKITPPAGTQKQITSPNTCLTFIGSTILNNLKTLHCIMKKSGRVVKMKVGLTWEWKYNLRLTSMPFAKVLLPNSFSKLTIIALFPFVS